MDFFFGGDVKNKVYEKNPKTVYELKDIFMTHSEKLMKIEICATLCVRVFWKNEKNVTMLVEDILSTSEIKQFLFKIQLVFLYSKHAYMRITNLLSNLNPTPICTVQIKLHSFSVNFSVACRHAFKN